MIKQISLFKTIIGLEYFQFIDLIEISIKCGLKSLNDDLTEKSGNKISIRPSSDLILCFLLRIRQGVSFKMLKSIIEIDFKKWFWKICAILYSYGLTCFIKWDYTNIFEDSVLFYGRKLVAIGDGTEQPVKDFLDKSESLAVYSGKKGFNSITKFCWVTPKGRLILSSNSYRGALVDINICSQDKYILNLPKNAYVGVDGGIKGIKDYYKNYITPIESRGTLTDDEKEWNDKFKTHRTVVENYFAAIKKFKILNMKFRFNGDLEEVLSKHNQIFMVCAFLLQKYIYPKGLRTL